MSDRLNYMINFTIKSWLINLNYIDINFFLCVNKINKKQILHWFGIYPLLINNEVTHVCTKISNKKIACIGNWKVAIFSLIHKNNGNIENHECTKHTQTRGFSFSGTSLTHFPPSFLYPISTQCLLQSGNFEHAPWRAQTSFSTAAEISTETKIIIQICQKNNTL